MFPSTLASPIGNSSLCKEDPALEIRKPKKDRTPRDCAWLSTQNVNKQNKICDKLQRKNRNICPVTCDLTCECPASFGSGDLVDGGDCSSFIPGLSCDDNYEYINGCGSSDSITCTAIDTYTCNRGKWTKSSFVNLPCVGNIFPPSGQKCDPTACPFNDPAISSTCVDARVGKDCHYDYKIFGCSDEDAQCTASKFYTCMEDLTTWIMAVVDPPYCGVPVKPIEGNFAIGDSCDPGEFCTFQPPESKNCDDVQVGLSCPYNYQYVGCNFEDGFSCIAIDNYYCDEEKQWERAILAPLPCVDPDPGIPSGKSCEPCPAVKPAGVCPPSKPIAGRECYIDYRGECDYFGIKGCSADELEYTVTSRFTCDGWRWVEDGKNSRGILANEQYSNPRTRNINRLQVPHHYYTTHFV